MKQQPGVVSMMSALMVSVLMIVASMGLVVYISSSTQQGSDDELSMRAYAAAQGGVEWAYNQVLNGNLTGFPNCTGTQQNNNLYTLGAASASASFQNTITCLRITNSSTATRGNFNAQSDSTQATIYGAVKYIRVEWLAKPDEGGATIPDCNGCSSQLPANDGATPPAIELTIVNYTGDASTVNASTIKVRNVVLLPDDDTTTWLSNYSKATIRCNSTGEFRCDTGDPAINGGIFNVCANSTTPGDCPGENPAGTVTVVYARALYLNNTNSNVGYQLQFYNSANALLTVPSSNTTIDVTARSGPVYRRVVAMIPRDLVPGGLNYVLFSDTDICKAFTVADPAAGLPSPVSNTGGCPYP